MFKKNQKVIAVDGRFEARVITRHKNGTITIKQGFLLKDGIPINGTYTGYVYRIDPTLVQTTD